MEVGGEKGEKCLGALVLRLTSEVGAHNKIQSDRTNHRSRLEKSVVLIGPMEMN